MNAETSCAEMRARLSGYHDGELPAALADEIRAHLGGCASCRGELAAIAAVAELAGEAAVEGRDDFEDRVAARLGAWRAARGPWAARARLARRLSLYAAAALLAALAGLGPAVMGDLRGSAARVSDDQILYLALVENGSGDEEDWH